MRKGGNDCQRTCHTSWAGSCSVPLVAVLVALAVSTSDPASVVMSATSGRLYQGLNAVTPAWSVALREHVPAACGTLHEEIWAKMPTPTSIKRTMGNLAAGFSLGGGFCIASLAGTCETCRANTQAVASVLLIPFAHHMFDEIAHIKF